jgi:hypothetical protein
MREPQLPEQDAQEMRMPLEQSCFCSVFSSLSYAHNMCFEDADPHPCCGQSNTASLTKL